MHAVGADHEPTSDCCPTDTATSGLCHERIVRLLEVLRFSAKIALGCYHTRCFCLSACLPAWPAAACDRCPWRRRRLSCT